MKCIWSLNLKSKILNNLIWFSLSLNLKTENHELFSVQSVQSLLSVRSIQSQTVKERRSLRNRAILNSMSESRTSRVEVTDWKDKTNWQTPLPTLNTIYLQPAAHKPWWCSFWTSGLPQPCHCYWGWVQQLLWPVWSRIYHLCHCHCHDSWTSCSQPELLKTCSWHL